MGNITQKNSSKNRASTNPILERITSNENGFVVTLAHEMITPNSSRNFTTDGLSVNFMMIGNDMYLSMEPSANIIIDHAASQNTVYSVSLSSQNHLPNYVLELKLDELMFFATNIQLKEYVQADGSLVFSFEKKMSQNLTASPMTGQQTLNEPASLISQPEKGTLILPEQKTAELSPTLSPESLTRTSSIASQQTPAQETPVLTEKSSQLSSTLPPAVTSESSTLSQQTLTQPSITSQQRSAQEMASVSPQQRSENRETLLLPEKRAAQLSPTLSPQSLTGTSPKASQQRSAQETPVSAQKSPQLSLKLAPQTLTGTSSKASQQRSAQETPVSAQKSSQLSSKLAPQTLTRTSSKPSQQRSAQETPVSARKSSQLSSTLLPAATRAASPLSQQTLTQPSISSQQRSAQPSSASTQQNLEGKLKLEQIEKSSDNSFAIGKFRLTVSEIRNLVEARSPLFSFDNMQIGFTVTKNSRNNGDESLRVLLHHKDLHGGSLSMESKLISFISRNPIIRKFHRSNVQSNFTFSDMIQWKQLFSSPNIFVRNDSCVIEVEIKIGKNRMPMIQADEQNNYNNKSSRTKCPNVRASRQNSSSSMECPICMDEMANKPKCSTECGHIFCTPCIARSLKTKSICPLCNKPVSAASLRPIFSS